MSHSFSNFSVTQSRDMLSCLMRGFCVASARPNASIPPFVANALFASFPCDAARAFVLVVAFVELKVSASSDAARPASAAAATPADVASSPSATAIVSVATLAPVSFEMNFSTPSEALLNHAPSPSPVISCCWSFSMPCMTDIRPISFWIDFSISLEEPKNALKPCVTWPMAPID